jgi:hypothetical protein
MNDRVAKYLISLGYKQKTAERGVEGLLAGWRAAIRKISAKNSDWIIHDFWYSLIMRSVLDEVLLLLSDEERNKVTEELTRLDEEFKKNTSPTLHRLNKTSRATPANVWRDYRLPHNIKLDEDLLALIQEAKDAEKAKQTSDSKRIE